jgi:hypothetical protein
MADFADAVVSLDGMGATAGTVLTSVVSGRCTVDIGGAQVVVDVARDIAASVIVNDVVLIIKLGSSRWAISRLFAATPPPPPPPTDEDASDPSPAPKPTVITGSLVCSPVATDTFRDGSWRTDTNDVLQGIYAPRGNNTGCAFYGTKPRSLAGATVTSASIRVRRLRAGSFSAQTATLRLVTQATKPGGAPTLTSSTTGPTLKVEQTNNAFPVPTSWAQAMVDGTAGGLAVFDSNGSPYMRFAGRNSWSAAWTMTIKYRRVT